MTGMTDHIISQCGTAAHVVPLPGSVSSTGPPDRCAPDLSCTHSGTNVMSVYSDGKRLAICMLTIYMVSQPHLSNPWNAVVPWIQFSIRARGGCLRSIEDRTQGSTEASYGGMRTMASHIPW